MAPGHFHDQSKVDNRSCSLFLGNSISAGELEKSNQQEKCVKRANHLICLQGVFVYFISLSGVDAYAPFRPTKLKSFK